MKWQQSANGWLAYRRKWLAANSHRRMAVAQAMKCGENDIFGSSSKWRLT